MLCEVALFQKICWSSPKLGVCRSDCYSCHADLQFQEPQVKWIYASPQAHGLSTLALSLQWGQNRLQGRWKAQCLNILALFRRGSKAVTPNSAGQRDLLVAAAVIRTRCSNESYHELIIIVQCRLWFSLCYVQVYCLSHESGGRHRVLISHPNKYLLLLQCYLAY